MERIEQRHSYYCNNFGGLISSTLFFIEDRPSRSNIENRLLSATPTGLLQAERSFDNNNNCLFSPFMVHGYIINNCKSKKDGGNWLPKIIKAYNLAPGLKPSMTSIIIHQNITRFLGVLNFKSKNI